MTYEKWDSVCQGVNGVCSWPHMQYHEIEMTEDEALRVVVLPK